jgi:carbon-monoxide dehydrogenase medium subunit
MKPAPFEYHAPETLDEAVGLLASLEDAKVLAGGQSLIPILALRLSRFDHLIDLGGVQELTGIRRTNGALTIGAMTTEADIEESPEVAAAAPLVARATPLIGHFQIRNRGTIGGSLAHADPSAEYPAVAVALDAELELRNASGVRKVPASEFFEATFMTAAEDDEILTAVHFPVWSGSSGVAVEEVARRHGDFAIVGVAAAVQVDGGRIARAAAALFGVGGTPHRAAAAEAALVGSGVDDADLAEVGRRAAEGLDPPGDVHASAAYRRELAAVLTGRAFSKAIKEAIGHE